MVNYEDLIKRKLKTAICLDAYAEDEYDYTELLDYLWCIIDLQSDSITYLKRKNSEKINKEYQGNMQLLVDIFTNIDL